MHRRLSSKSGGEPPHFPQPRGFAMSGALEVVHLPRRRIRVNLSKAPEWFLGAALSRVSNPLGRCPLWQSPLLASDPRSRSVWSAAVYRRFPSTVLIAWPHQSGAEAHALQTLRAAGRARVQAASVRAPHLSLPKVDAYARLRERAFKRDRRAEQREAIEAVVIQPHWRWPLRRTPTLRRSIGLNPSLRAGESGLSRKL